MVTFGESFYEGSCTLHRTLNSPGYVPFVGTVTGLARIVVAVAGFAFSTLGAVLSLPFNFESSRYFVASAVVHLLNIYTFCVFVLTGAGMYCAISPVII